MNIERPDSCPREGQIEAFDAGWNAHEVGLSRETTRVFSASPDWAVLAWDVRNNLASRTTNETEEELDTTTTTRGDVRRAIKEAHYQASIYAKATGARKDKRREDKLWAILKEMEHGPN